MPRLFVVVPFWNCEDLLARCLASLEVQTEAATMVLVDDASDLPAQQLAMQWCGRGEGRVYLSRTENGGPAAGRHDGLQWVLEHATSDEDVVVLVDGDDELAHERALEIIADVYRTKPGTLMTLGGQRRASGKPVYRRRYQAWHFRYRLARAAPWRARCPRTFRVSLLRKAWRAIRPHWPDGSWIRSATDVVLLMPMLARLRWPELVQLEDVLYVYNDARPDGLSTASSVRGRMRQLYAEGYARRSVLWGLIGLPRVVLIAAQQRIVARQQAESSRG